MQGYDDSCKFMAQLELKNIKKTFDHTTVLEDVNVTVNDSEFVVLVGPSGSGKSTILRVIAGLENPSEGEICLDGKKINKLLPKDRDIAMVFQNYALYPHMSVKDNLAFPLKMLKLSSDQIDKNVNETAELLGISQHLLKKPRDLSGGERQRVALGRAIIRKPKLFLMDEPLSNLDAKLRTQMRTELLKLHSSLNATVIYVTHDQIEALTMGHRIVVLNHGRVQQIDTPHNIYHNPGNAFVAGFIGNPGVNFFDAKISSKNNISVGKQSFSVNIPENIYNFMLKKNCLNKDILLGVRPEHLALCDLDIGIVLNGKVDLVEMLGNEYLIYATFHEHVNKRCCIKLNSLLNVKQGTAIKCSIDLKYAHFFDKESGVLIS